jgi:predicted nucleic acid-binding protein
MQKPQLVAVDANVLILLADGHDLTLDAWQTILNRLRPVQLLVPPTVFEELSYHANQGEDPDLKRLSNLALRGMRARWQCQPAFLTAIQEDIAANAAKHLLEAELIPYEEKNDALLLAESAVLGCLLLLTHDAHLRGVDFEELHLLPRARFDSARHRHSTRSRDQVLLLGLDP